MKDIYQKSHIMLVHHDESEELVRAPEGFMWIPYQPIVDIGGKLYEYSHFCREAIPRYRELRTDEQADAIARSLDK